MFWQSKTVIACERLHKYLRGVFKREWVDDVRLATNYWWIMPIGKLILAKEQDEHCFALRMKKVLVYRGTEW